MPPPANRPGRVDPLVGSVIAGRYRIEARIASGGMGTVYRAEQLGLERKVALKLLHAAALEGTEDSQSQDDFEVLEKRFSREAAILARLAHPNIVTIFDYGSVEPGEDDRGRARFYMAMELLGGETLQERLSSRKKLTLDECISLGRQIARGLREAHAQGIVHRDLKPANIMIVRDRDGDEVVKLLDFGIGKVLATDDPSQMSTTDPRAELTQEGRFVGSPMYMAPEQIAHGHVDLRADIYSFGTVLYRSLAGVHPFHKDNTALVMLAHLHEKPVPLREKVPEAPARLAELVDRCMAKDPNARPAGMEDILRTLQDMSPVSSGGRTAAIAPLPAYQEGPTIATGQFSSEAHVTPHTTSRPQTITGTQTLPMMIGEPKKRTPLIVIGAALAIGVFTLVFFLARKDSPAGATQPSTTATAEPPFKLVLDSTPAGAEVREGDRLHGTTPLTLTIEPASVADTPRTFVLSLAGHQPYTRVQGPSKESVHIVAALVAAAPEAPSSPTVPGATPTPPTAPTTKPTLKTATPKASATAPPLDIIPKR